VYQFGVQTFISSLTPQALLKDKELPPWERALSEATAFGELGGLQQPIYMDNWLQILATQKGGSK
jgi:hypothetical protein